MPERFKHTGETSQAKVSDAIGEPEYFLLPLLATDAVPHLFDSDGNPLDAEGHKITGDAELSQVHPGVCNLMTEALGQDPEHSESFSVA